MSWPTVNEIYINKNYDFFKIKIKQDTHRYVWKAFIEARKPHY